METDKAIREGRQARQKLPTAMAKEEFIQTIDSDDEDIADLDEDEDIDEMPEEVAPIKANKKRKRAQEEPEIAGDFIFEADTDAHVSDLQGWQFDGQTMNRQKAGVNIDDIIKKRKLLAQPTNKTEDDQADAPSGSDEEEGDASESEDGQAEQEGEFTGFASDDEDVPEDGFGAGAPDEEVAEEDESGTEGVDEDSGLENVPKKTAVVGEEDEDSDGDAGVSHPDDLDAGGSDIEEEDQVSAAEKQRQKDFFAPEEDVAPISAAETAKLANFQHMNLSRPILRALTAMNFSSATPIQAKAIPVALMGKDVVGGAVTGSGKTAAFMIPILERLLYRPKKVSSTRVLVLCPTRELAMQCHAVSKKLAAFTDIRCALVVGGLSLKLQETELRTRPDIVIATPGRFIDHVRNSQGFTVENIEIMVMDEADRMLEEGFADELNEIITACPRSRQTMLFSATMTEKVDDLIRLSLNRPVRLMVDAKKSTAENLVQEFIRIRPQREQTRPAILAHLCTTLFRQRVIIFFRSKVYAHKMRIIFGLLDLKAGELHGNLSQEQRIQALESFRDGKIDFLLATDVASRGLDIKAIDTVINYEAPQSHEIYLHRVGRTARAGRQGRSVTLAGEADRKVVKAAVKSSNALKSKVQSRALDVAVIDAMHAKLTALELEIEGIMKDEAQERQLKQAEMELRKGENAITYADEIRARPRRTWFANEDEKKGAHQRGAERLNPASAAAAGSAASSKQQRSGGKQEARPVSNKDKKRLDDRRERKESAPKKKKSSFRQR